MKRYVLLPACLPACQRGCTKACSARSIARPMAAALLTVSSYSLSGTLSATRPAPACRWTSHSRRLGSLVDLGGGGEGSGQWWTWRRGGEGGRLGSHIAAHAGRHGSAPAVLACGVI